MQGHAYYLIGSQMNGDSLALLVKGDIATHYLFL